MRPLRSLFALAVAVSTSVALLPVLTPAASAAPIETGDPTVIVEIVPGTAGRISAGSDLTVTVRITNSSDTVLPDGVASLLLDPSAVADRDALTEWLVPIDADAPTDAIADGPIADIPTPTLLAGDSRTLTGLIVPGAELPFAPDGPLAVHRLSVTVSAGNTDVTERSAVAVDPGTPVPAARLAVAMPITLPPSTVGVVPAADLETYTAVGGILDRQLQEASASPVAVGIDPRIIASILLLGTSAPESAIDWLDRLRTIPNETFPLGYADSDIAATSQAAGSILSPAGFVTDPDLFPAETDAAAGGEGAPPPPSGSPDPAVPEVPTQEELLDWDYSATGIAWPRDDSVVAADLDVFAASGLPTTILSSTNSTAEGAPNASASSNGHAIITSDASLSRFLRSAVAAPTTVERDAAVARLTASLAVISAQYGASDPVVLATLDRTTPGDSFPLAGTLAAVSEAPWTTPATLSEARAQPATEVAVADRPVDPSRIGLLTEMVGGEPAIEAFSSVLADPVPLSGERRLSLLALASQAWAVAGGGWEAAVEEYRQRSAEILASVAVGSRTLTQASDNGDLPIVVTNALDFPVSVTVNVQARRPIPILAIRDAAVEITIAPNSQQRASIPTESIANGEVALAVSLTSPTGVTVGETRFVDVSVRAGWETAVTTVLAVLVVAVFILGVIRTVRRRRRIARGELADERDGDVRDLHDGATAASGGRDD